MGAGGVAKQRRRLLGEFLPLLYLAPTSIVGWAVKSVASFDHCLLSMDRK